MLRAIADGAEGCWDETGWNGFCVIGGELSLSEVGVEARNERALGALAGLEMDGEGIGEAGLGWLKFISLILPFIGRVLLGS